MLSPILSVPVQKGWLSALKGLLCGSRSGTRNLPLCIFILANFPQCLRKNAGRLGTVLALHSFCSNRVLRRVELLPNVNSICLASIQGKETQERFQTIPVLFFLLIQPISYFFLPLSTSKSLFYNQKDQKKYIPRENIEICLCISNFKIKLFRLNDVNFNIQKNSCQKNTVFFLECSAIFILYIYRVKLYR